MKQRGYFLKTPYRIVKTTLGVTSILSEETGEIMHNPVGPWDEAHNLYINPSQLAVRMKAIEEEQKSHPLNAAYGLSVYDVGLGAAGNALALLHNVYGDSRCLVYISSFEIDISLLQFAYDHRGHFPFFEKFEGAVRSLLETGQWQSQNVEWTLYQGSFLDTVGKAKHKANLVFYDPYSSKKNPEMWTQSCFEKLYEACSDDVLFLNYSRSTAVRGALLAAGFYVGYGGATGAKESTTQAARTLKALEQPLGDRWLRRWERSHCPYPPGCDDTEVYRGAVLSHPQFAP